MSKKIKEIQINDKHDRSILAEGRNYGMGFAFLKQIEENTYDTVSPISPCKDYLNDVIYSEAIDKPCNAYGLSYNKQNIFKDDYGFLAIKICKRWINNDYPSYNNDVKTLQKNFKLLEQFMQYFDTQLVLPVQSSIEEANDNIYLVKVPYFWCQYTYLISVYALLLRVGYLWNGDKDIMEYLKAYTGNDLYILQQAIIKLKKIMEGNIPVQNMKEYHGGSDVHNMGIIGYNKF